MNQLLLLVLCSLLFLIKTTYGDEYRSLVDGWSLQNENGTVELSSLSIPNGVYSALEEAQVTESVLYSFNDVALRWIGLDKWTYSLHFEVTKDELTHSQVLLAFHGLDTLADIYLNEQLLGSTDNMFVRYRFDVKKKMIVGKNELVIKFQSAVTGAKNLNMTIPPQCPPLTYSGECHVNLIRKMQASFAWDWGLAAPSVGIWQKVYLELYDSAQIRDVTYKLIDGDLKEEEESVEDDLFWSIIISVHMETGLQMEVLEGVMSFEILDIPDSKGINNFQLTSDDKGEVTAEVTMIIKKSDTKRWWPNGYGEQMLYNIKVVWEDSKKNEVFYSQKHFFTSEKIVNIGFRTVELIQDPLENGNSFYFKVNGVPIFMKGSNWITSHILPEKSADLKKLKELLLAAKEANMNMLRVWGGGVYESNKFYYLADEYGILIWQDMMFACAMYRKDDDFLESVRVETRQQVRRIQHHPSIAIFATNNENEVALRQNWYGTGPEFKKYADDYEKLYVETITDEIMKNDVSRIVLTSSPSNGINNDGKEYGIARNPQDPHYGDIHYYNIVLNGWDSKIYQDPRFASEYGFQSFPAGFNAVLRPKEDDLTKLVNHRQHHPDKNGPIEIILNHNLQLDWNVLTWDDKVYLSQLSQAMAIKAETEHYRAGRGGIGKTMGALFWQLNDVWVAPSWSSIEYNGNFKILQQWIKIIFAPQTIITQFEKDGHLHIYGVSDQIDAEPQEMVVKMNIFKWSDFRVVHQHEYKFTMRPNAVVEVMDNFNFHDFLNQHQYDAFQHLAEYSLLDKNDNVIFKNFVFPELFKSIKSVKDPKLTINIASNRCENNFHRVAIEIKIQSPAIFIYIELRNLDIPKYRLSKNGFMQLEPIQTLQVTFDNPKCQFNVTASDFNVQTLNKFVMK
ncbi:unnamed protein product [Diamesa serratosioi]